MTRNLMIALCLAVPLLLAGCQGSINLSTPTQTPTTAEAQALTSLNGWNTEALDLYECPNRHPNTGSDGETDGIIGDKKMELRDKGIYVRWNCKTQAYEITTKDNQAPSCGCQ